MQRGPWVQSQQTLGTSFPAGDVELDLPQGSRSAFPLTCWLSHTGSSSSEQKKHTPPQPPAGHQVYLSVGSKAPGRLEQGMQVAQKQGSEERTSPFPLQEFPSSFVRGSHRDAKTHIFAQNPHSRHLISNSTELDLLLSSAPHTRECRGYIDS